MAEDDIVLITHLPSDSWFEGSAMRPNGQMVISRLDSPEVWLINPDREDIEPHLLRNLSNATGAINLCALEGRTDEYAVLAGVIDVTNIIFENFVIWRMVLSSNDEDPNGPPNVSMSKIGSLPDAGLVVGVRSVSEYTLLIQDSGKACIWQMDTRTGDSTVLVADDLMAPAPGESFGINRVRVAGGFLWFTNSSDGTLCRIPFVSDETPEGTVHTTGDLEIMTDEIKHCDGLVCTKDATTFWTLGYMDGLVWRIDIDPSTGQAQTKVILENLVNPLTIEMKYLNGKPRLYVVCSGEIDIGWNRNDDNPGWSDIADINSMVAVTSVTVTETEDEAM